VEEAHRLAMVAAVRTEHVQLRDVVRVHRRNAEVADLEFVKDRAVHLQDVIDVLDNKYEDKG
jgi:hypothetical protein